VNSYARQWVCEKIVKSDRVSGGGVSIRGVKQGRGNRQGGPGPSNDLCSRENSRGSYSTGLKLTSCRYFALIRLPKALALGTEVHIINAGSSINKIAELLHGTTELVEQFCARNQTNNSAKLRNI
jgi:hypothetical protein